MVIVRDTTNRDGGTLAFSAAAWERFLGACPERREVFAGTSTQVMSAEYPG